MSKRYEREIEEILKRSRSGGSGPPREPIPFRRPERPSGRPAPAWAAPLSRILTTPAERLIGLSVLLGLAAFLLQMQPNHLLPVLFGWAGLAVFWFAVIGGPLGMLPGRQQRYWRDRPMDIRTGSAPDLTRSFGHTWWRLRGSFRRWLNRR